MKIRFDDTIAAVATPPGEGGLCVIRMSGPSSYKIADRVFRGSSVPSESKSHTVLYGNVIDPATHFIIDEVLLTILRAPRTYTREDVVEISGHGGTISSRRILEVLINSGVRLADPGEFTKRAFINGRIDLVQAEAVAELIRARTDACARSAVRQLGGQFSSTIGDLRHRILSVLALIEVGLDFTEEGLKEIEQGHILQLLNGIQDDLVEVFNRAVKYRVLKDGVRVALVGKPNVGKSSLLNHLLDRNRAIVDANPGTTRDTIEETIDLNGLPVTFVDTAGIHKSQDPIENQGISRAQNEIREADLVLVIIDASLPLIQDDYFILNSIPHERVCMVLNKSDLEIMAQIQPHKTQYEYKSIYTSALNGAGIDALKMLIFESVISDDIIFESDVLMNSRHHEQLLLAQNKLAQAVHIMTIDEGSEVAAIEIRDVAVHLGSIIGLDIGDQVLDLVFSQFCIGK